MTQVQQYPIECECGNIIEIDLYQSVNVTVDPSLLKMVQKRKINNYKCQKCGAKSELAYHFLYVDMDKSQWIWCYPEAEKDNKKKIKHELLQNKTLLSMIQKLGQPKPMIVFGYDQLLKIV